MGFDGEIGRGKGYQVEHLGCGLVVVVIVGGGVDSVDTAGRGDGVDMRAMGVEK